MIRTVVCATLAFCLIFLAACSGPAVDKEDPVSVARVSAEAWMRSDVDALVDVACEKMRVQLEKSRAEMEQMAEVMRSMGVDMKDVNFDFSEVTFEATHEDDYAAKVLMHGPLKVSVPGQANEIRDLNIELGMVHEDGGWKLCSEIN